jgi:uncharacterized protein (DUF433 family)
MLVGTLLSRDTLAVSKTVVMTLRLPLEVAQSVQRIAGRSGHKPAQIGVRLVEEGLRRRDYPHIDLRETSSGRVAYIAGTRFAVYWVAQTLGNGMSIEKFSEDHSIPIERLRMALAYADAYPKEIGADAAQADANRAWLERQESSFALPRLANAKRRKGRARR